MTQRPRRIRWITVASCALLIVGTFVAQSSSNFASAAGPCAAPNTNEFDGVAVFPAAGDATRWFEGTSSYLVVQNPALCTGVNTYANRVSAWVMIASSVSNLAYVQVGYIKSADFGHVRWFFEANNGYTGANLNFDFYPSSFSVDAEAGVRHSFSVNWRTSDDFVHGDIDSVPWGASTFNPYRGSYSGDPAAVNRADFGAQPWSPQYEGEGLYTQSDIPGIGSSHASFTYMGVQKFSDDAFENLPCGYDIPDSDNYPRWTNSASGCTTASIWTLYPNPP